MWQALLPAVVTMAETPAWLQRESGAIRGLPRLRPGQSGLILRSRS